MERILPVFNNHTQATRFLIFGPEGLLRRHEYTVDVPTRPAADMTRRLMNTVITTYDRDVATAHTEFQRLGSSHAAAEPCLAANRVWMAHCCGARQPAAPSCSGGTFTSGALICLLSLSPPLLIFAIKGLKNAFLRVNGKFQCRTKRSRRLVEQLDVDCGYQQSIVIEDPNILESVPSSKE